MRVSPLAAFVIVVLGPTRARASLDDEAPRTPGAGTKALWADVGVGAGGAGLASSLAVNAELSAHGVRYRHLETQNFAIFAAPVRLAEEGLLYARRWEWSFGHAGLGAGLGIAHGNQLATTPAVPLEAQLFLGYRVIGVGVHGFADLNARRPFAGGFLALHFGAIHSL